MNMHWIDWAIVFGLLLFIVGSAIYTNRYTRSVADFLAANRSAGRYLLCIASGIAGLGAISVVAFFEMYYEAGFTAIWWKDMMWMPLTLLIALSGWVVYRFRETRALTLPQFFEMRYGRSFRIFSGFIIWISGIVNFGIFPSVGARFFIHFCGLPMEVPGIGLPMYETVMFLLLAVSLFFVFIGGQIAVMITDFFQGMFTNVVFLIILVALFFVFDWPELMYTLKTAPAPDASLLHPFRTSAHEGFNIWYFLIQVFTVVYGFRAWQGSQGYNCSAKTAHEAKMAGILGEWRGIVFTIVIMLLPIGAYVIMHHPDQAATAQEVTEALGRIENPTIQKQMTVPLVLAKVLPTGVVGLLCAVMLMAFISTHDTYLHSWGSIFVQDVVLPFRKKPLTPRQHIRLLRLSILFVAVFIFCWSMLFKQTEYIFMFFAITGAIWLGGAGSVIIGGLYWKHGSTKGAFASLIIGAVVALSGIGLQVWWPRLYSWMDASMPGLLASVRYVLDGISGWGIGIHWEVTPEKFPIDGQWVNFFAMITAIAAYIGFSLYDWLVLRKRPANMDRLLHRGKYAIAGEHLGGASAPAQGWRSFIPSPEFTLGDKCIYYGKLIWSCGWVAVFLVGVGYQVCLVWPGFVEPSSIDTWAAFWSVWVVIAVVFAVFTTIWFAIGGILDMKDLFRTLANLKRDDMDDGRVLERYDIDDEAEPQQTGE